LTCDSPFPSGASGIDVTRASPGLLLDAKVDAAAAAGAAAAAAAAAVWVVVAAGDVNTGENAPRCNARSGGAVANESCGASDSAMAVEVTVVEDDEGTITKSEPGETGSSSLMGGGGGTEEVDRAIKGDKFTSRDSW